MSLSVGSRLGPYEVQSAIGAGGMGEVYRARDTRLNRAVAIKILPASLTSDPDLLARFQREAQVLAALNHPNIAAIHHLEETSGGPAIVMELVEGETLAHRVAQGPIPIEEVLAITKQIADALECAHEMGIIHRDLKPANVKLRPDGTVKVLDFGLAKLIAGNVKTDATPNDLNVSFGSGGLSAVPTATALSIKTRAGAIMGTAPYVSPEQAKGKPADRRSDIWAFGCLLYEMLTGQRAFGSDDATDTLIAVVRSEPDWNALPAQIPAGVRELLARCLIKDPRNRLQAIGDARIAIDEVQGGTAIDRDVAQTPAPSVSKVWMRIATGLFVTTIVFATLWILAFSRPVAPPPREVRVEVVTPPTADPLSFAISPDGKRLVFSASKQGKSQLWVRALDSVAAQPLAGTDDAKYPFWSPDSATIGFFADSKLKRIDVAGGAPQALANAVAGAGGTWNREGTILFAPTGANPLSKVPAAGGEPVVVTRLETGQGSHQFPQFLSDGRHFIYFAQGGPGQGVYSGSLDGGAPKRLTNADAAAVVSPSGFLLFVRHSTLFAQAFDSERQELSGNPFAVAEQAACCDGLMVPGFSASTGIVAYRTGSIGSARQLTWLDRSGKRVGTIGSADNAELTIVELSPDGKRIGVGRTVNGNTDVWLIDSSRGVPTRFTFDAANDLYPVWSPDGNRVAFASTRKGVFNLYWKSSNGIGADELLLESDQGKVPTDWSADGRFLVFRSNDPQTGFDLLVLPLFGDRRPTPFLKTPFAERDGQFSPDGKWIAYQSNESGQFEVYVQPFPGPGGKFQISADGGAQPRWNKNGTEIFYVSLDGKMMVAPVKSSPDGQSMETGTPATLFPVRIAGGPLPGAIKQQYAVSSDGQRFLINLLADEGVASPITLILNWEPKP